MSTSVSSIAVNTVANDHNYAPSCNDFATSSDDDLMDVSDCDEPSTIYSDCTTQICYPVSTDASTQVEPVLKVDAEMQTDNECDNWMRRYLFVGHITENNDNCRFWTGIQTISLLNFLFEWVLPCAQNVPLLIT